MDRRDSDEANDAVEVRDANAVEGISREVLDAFVSLARGDLSVRLERSYKRDTADTLAYFVNLIAEEMGRVLASSEASHQNLHDGVARLNEVFLLVAAGDFSVRAPRDGSGDPLDVLGFLLDSLIAELGETFSEVERQRSTLQGIFDSMADAIIVVGPDGRIETVNGETIRLLGWSNKDLERMFIAHLLGPREKELGRALSEDQQLQPFRARPTEFVDRRGAKLQLSVNGTPLARESDSKGRFVLVARDDRELRSAQEQLQLADRMATMGTLAAGVAHEINNPLSYVISNLEFVLEELDELGENAVLEPEFLAEIVRALTSSKTGSERIAEIVRDLKSISRTDDSSIEDVELARVADAAATMLKNEIRHRARFRKVYNDAPLIRANEARVMQIVLNLLQNAAQAIPPGHVSENEIKLEIASSDDGQAMLSVTDTGSGIPEADLVEIFQAFYTTKPLGKGTGLGLSICQRLVNQMGGRIEVDSTEGVGTTFRVLFPASGAKEVTSVSASVKAQAAARRRILVVDDEREIGDSVQRALADEHDVDFVMTGAEALERFADGDYYLVLIDWLMPNMSGRELRDAINARFPDHGAHLVVMSGGSVSMDFSLVDSVLEKPFSPSALRGLIEKLGST